MISKLDPVRREEMKLRRLELIKERYRKLILEPRKEIEFEMQHEMDDDFEFDFAN